MKDSHIDKNKKQLPLDPIELYIDRIKKPPLFSIDLHLSHRENLTSQSIKRT